MSCVTRQRDEICPLNAADTLALLGHNLLYETTIISITTTIKNSADLDYKIPISSCDTNEFNKHDDNTSNLKFY